MYQSRAKKIRAYIICSFVGGLLSLIWMGCTFRWEKGDPIAAEPTYEFLEANLFRASCNTTGCHDAATEENHNINLTSWSHIAGFKSQLYPSKLIMRRPYNSSIYEVLLNGSMPKNRAPVRREIVEALCRWIARGALETGLGIESKSEQDCIGIPRSCALTKAGCNDPVPRVGPGEEGEKEPHSTCDIEDLDCEYNCGIDDLDCGEEIQICDIESLECDDVCGIENLDCGD